MKTPLFEQHRRLGAKMTEFAGWDMPLSYAGTLGEVEAVRTSAGLFDLSHMGEIEVHGRQSAAFLNSVITNDVDHLALGDAQYTVMCDESGGILEDFIIYRLEEELFLLVVNASNVSSDFQWLEQHILMGAHIEDKSAQTAMLGLQGPESSRLLQDMVDTDLGSMRRFTIRRDRVGKVNCLLARTGYTGEDGFEIYCSAGDANQLWSTILRACAEAAPEPAGLAARDILRIEAGYPLYGNELLRTVTPVEAGLMWTVRLTKEGFVGKTAIEAAVENGPAKVLVGLDTEDRRVLRHGYPVIVLNKHVGDVTSGTYSPTLERSIAMAYVGQSHSAVGTSVNVQIRGEPCRCRVVGLPFYKARN